MADVTSFKRLMGRNVTGVAVVTAQAGDDRHGMTCNAFLSVSVAPPTVLVSLSKGSRTEQIISRSRAFTLNLLGDTQSAHSDRFAGRHKDKEGDRFEGISWKAGATGAPVFEGVVGHVDCKVVRVYDGGDHTLFVGEAAEAHFDESRRPLVYSQGQYLSLDSLKPI